MVTTYARLMRELPFLSLKAICWKSMPVSTTPSRTPVPSYFLLRPAPMASVERVSASSTFVACRTLSVSGRRLDATLIRETFAILATSCNLSTGIRVVKSVPLENSHCISTPRASSSLTADRSLTRMKAEMNCLPLISTGFAMGRSYLARLRASAKGIPFAFAFALISSSFCSKEISPFSSWRNIWVVTDSLLPSSFCAHPTTTVAAKMMLKSNRLLILNLLL